MAASKTKGLQKDAATPRGSNKQVQRTVNELSKSRVQAIEKILGYTFQEKDLLAKALTHPSYLLGSKEQLNNNQRLEFLGDAVVQLALTDALYQKYPHKREGKLTSLRSGYARRDYMAQIARRLRLSEFLLLKPREREAGIGEQDSALGDVFESLVGAVYLDSDWETARALVLKLYNHLEESPIESGAINNPKGALQELIQPKHGNDAIRYETVRQEGQAHERQFEVSVFCQDTLLGTGKGTSKKEAAENAALQAIDRLKTKS